MRDLDEYLDRLLREARLDASRSARLREEIREHLESLAQDLQARGLPRDAARQKALDEFGEPDTLGRSLRFALGGWRAWRFRWLRPVPLALMLLFLGWTVNTYAFEVYSIVGSGAAPRLPQGSHVVVEKFGALHAEDIVVFREGDRSLVGIVQGRPEGESLWVRRHDRGTVAVDRSRVVGRVVWQVP